jgi:hypothetical protein
MDFNKLRESYCNFYSIDPATVSSEREDFLKTYETITQEIVSNEEYSLLNSKFYSGYKIPLNTTVAADALVSRFDKGNTNFFPELALMFLKTYTKQLLSNSDFSLDPKKLISAFNKNQELSEIPYPLLLTLGGLYYFQENPIVLGDQKPSNLFGRINGVNNFTSNDVYDTQELYRQPGYYTRREYAVIDNRTSKMYEEFVYFPSVRLLNRSLYNQPTAGNEFDSEFQNTEFDIKTGVNGGNEVIDKIKIRDKSITPSVGFGIQNKFLNYYNKTLFGEYLNGSVVKANDTKPHVIAGGYTGILKPFKTYDSDIEFTAYYRNLYVGNINYNIDTLVNELNTVTKTIKRPSSGIKNVDEYQLFLGFIKAFVVYSKLKAAFLSGQFGSKQLLRNAIDALCKTYNINSKYNQESDNDSRLTDFYYLVSHVFFTAYKEVVKKDDIGGTSAKPHAFDINFRLSFGIKDSELYQRSALGDNLMNMLNSKHASQTEQVDSLTNFLHHIWSLEKSNLKNDYSVVDSKAAFAIYPSAGGFTTPNSLLTPRDPNFGSTLGIYGSNNYGYTNRLLNQPSLIKRYLYKEDDEVTFDSELGYSGNSIRSNMVDPLDTASVSQLFSNFSSSLSSGMKRNNPVVPKYVVEQNFNRINFLDNYCFNNHAILKNTTRFLWFENNHVGDDMKLDLNVATASFNETSDGLDLAFNPSEPENGYLKNITNMLFDYNTLDNFDQAGYSSMFNFSRLMDSINIEKLIEFSELFKEFATIDSKGGNNNTFNLNSLIKASTVLKSSEILSDVGGTFRDPKTGITLTGEEVWLTLIGNSMYNYEFTAKCGLSKFFNVALTSAQKKRCDEVVDQFCSHVVTIVNKSTVDSVTKLGDFQLSLHNFHSSPEVLFTNAKTYDELKTALMSGIDETSFNKLIARRILLGDQYVPPFKDLTSAEVGEIVELNKSYLYSRFNHLSFNTRGVSFSDYYVEIVRSFFKYLNIRYTKGNYKQLIKLIRSYSYTASILDNNLNVTFLPNNGIIDKNTFDTGMTQALNNRISTEYIKLSVAVADKTYVAPKVNFNNLKQPKTIEKPKPKYTQYSYDKAKITAAIESFFPSFNKSVFESTVDGLNGFLSRINSVISSRLNPDNENSLTKQEERESSIDEIKKATYYNIKSMYDKVSTGTLEQSAPLYSISKLEDLKSLEVTELAKTNLFYNYFVNPEYCYDGQALKSQSYDLYQIFQVVDRGNNDIGTRVLANLVYFYNNLYADFDAEPNKGQDSPYQSISNLTGGSFQKLFSGLAQESGFLFQQIPNYLNLNSALSRMDSDGDSIYQVVDDLFGVHTTTELFGESFRAKKNVKFGGLSGFPGFIFQLGTMSSKLDTNESVVRNDNLNSFCLDVGYDANREVIVKDENAPDEIKKSNITCFTVDFGTQNQQMFNSVQLDTAEFYDTEESIRTWVDIVNQTQQSPQTTNIFPILEKRSYSCTVSGLGNATIQPLTYFYLRNVPLFYGTYWITNVMHDIRPNTMTTTFKGVRQPIVNKNDIRKQLLYLMRKRAAEIRDANANANTIVTEGIPNTSGDIVSVPGSSLPYGEVMQQTDDGIQFFRFDGMTIIGTYIISITGSNSDNDANLGIINVLYNQSKALLNNSSDHTKIIASMKNIAVATMKQKAIDGDVRYGSGSLSLSKVVKENSSFSTTGQLGTLLNDITDLKNYTDKTSRLPKTAIISDIKALEDGGKSITNGNKPLTFVMDGQVPGVSADTIPMNEATFYFETKDKTIKANTTIDGVGVIKDDSTDYVDLFDLFNSLGQNGLISKVNSEVFVTKLTDEVNSNNQSSKPKNKAANQGDINAFITPWLDFMTSADGDGEASRFALFDSNGRYTKTQYENYLQKKGVSTSGDNSWDKVPKDKSNPNYALEGIYYNLMNSTNVVDPNDNNDIGFSLGSYGYKEYNLDSESERNTFIEDYKKVVADQLKYWEANNKKPSQTIKTSIGVKFLGSYEPGKVAFFTSNSNGSYGNIKWNNDIRKKYQLSDATKEQLEKEYVAKTLGSPDRARFITDLVTNAVKEHQEWGNETLKDTACGSDEKVTSLLRKYWKAYNGKDEFSCGEAWSGVFISYIIKTAAPNPNDFNYNPKHARYIVDARDGNKSWKAYSTKDAKNGVLQVGDLICYARNGGQALSIDLKDFTSEQSGHCDCVTEINTSGKFAKAIGGNVSNTVAYSTVNLNDDGTVNSNTRTVILRFEPVGTEEATVDGKVVTFSGSLTELIKSAGYDPNSAVGVMAAAIATSEGWTNKNTLAYKNNNPGNLDYDSDFKVYDPKVYKQQGNTKQTSRFAVFSKAEFGIKALIESKIKSWADGRMPITSTNSGAYVSEIGAWKKNQPPTFLQFFYTYAPPTDNNNPKQYAANVVKTINEKANKNLTVQSKVKDIFV